VVQGVRLARDARQRVGLQEAAGGWSIAAGAQEDLPGERVPSASSGQACSSPAKP
jgi:hypothetical protein